MSSSPSLKSRSLLKLNQQTVRNWIDQGDLPALRVGRRVRIRRADFDQLLVASSIGPANRALENSDLEEEVYQRVREAAGEGSHAVRQALRKYSSAQRGEILERVLADFAAELDQALSSGERPWGLDASDFLKRHASVSVMKRGGKPS